jgi:hypothetical protein
MKFVRYQLEKDIQVATMANKEWLKSRLCGILESNKESTAKADYLGLSLLSIDESVKSIDEEISELKALKDSLKLAKEVALEVGAEVFENYGIEKLEGLRVSSLTIHHPVVTPKVNFTVTNPQALIDAGFRKEVLDMDKLKECYNNGEYLDLINAHCDISITRETKTKKLKVNKRRSSNNTNFSLDMEVAS